MANNSPIEWTDATWNPIVGCSIVSPGCTHCYAMAMAARIEAMGNQPRYAGTTRKVNGNAIWTGKLAQAPDSVLLAPLKRKKPTTYFVNSMGDLFHEDCPDEWIDKVFAVMALSPQHTFQVLTKRAARMRDYCAHHADIWCPQYGRLKPLLSNEIILDLREGRQGPLPNVWLGTSTERQQEADERIPLLLQTPAAVRFISAEPLLGPIDLTRFSPVDADWNPRAAAVGAMMGLHWVIVGGESGAKARPMHPDWARHLRDQCEAAGVAFFFKQWGGWAPDDVETGAGTGRDAIFEGKGPCAKFADGKWEFSENGYTMPLGGDHDWMYRLGKKAAGRHLDGVLHDAMPQADGKSIEQLEQGA